MACTAKHLAREEQGRLEIILPAAWLHDWVNVPKNDPRRSQASRLSAQGAIEFLRSSGYPADDALLGEIGHAIESHSFSARIEPRSLEAAIVQDADRLDGIGALGIARCFAVGGMLGRRFYDPKDPQAQSRGWDDLVNTVDHFYVKLFEVARTLKTPAGRREGERRAETMRVFLQEFFREIG